MLPSKVIFNKAGRCVPVILAALIFAGCTSQDHQASRANAQGNASGTSDDYLQQMQQSADDNKVDWQLLAIKALLKEGKIPDASNQISQLPQKLSDVQRQEALLLQAQLKISQNDTNDAAQLLQQIDARSLSKEQQARYYSLQIAASGGRPSLDVLRAFIAQEPLLENPADKQKNIDATWQALMQMAPEQVNTMVINADENTLQGWLDLLNVYRANSGDLNMLKAGIADWQMRYPNNPAAKMLPGTLSQVHNFQPSSTGKIALLLPLSGQAQVFANAIQKGFNDAKSGLLAQASTTTQPASANPTIAAPGVAATAAPGSEANPVTTPTTDAAASQAPAAANSGQPAAQIPGSATVAAPASTAQVQVYDTSTQPIDQVLAQAEKDGATLVVGPLLKNNVEQLTSVQTPLNILALNKPESVQNHPNLCYFALSPEDEARDAAHHMWDQGKRAPLLMVPRSSLGDRLSKAFAAEWQKLGGATVVQQQFGSTAELKQGINSGAGLRLSGTPIITQAEQPQSVTVAGLTIPAPVTSPQTAGDGNVDSVYIVATQDEMALIKPMISMRVSSRSMVQTYASSRSFQAGAGPDYRLEMEGVQFSDAPLLIGSQPALLQQAAKNFNNDYSLVRLYAMGIDAWTLANHFNDIRQTPGYQIQAQTGNLSATTDCIINRKLIWSQYHQGQIVPVS
ncbi:penicillin-binding protein activator [Erwinia tracheiphila]|uniref:Penicillin-binding protein activator LpoA n=1 Tax=Erwinia tracheiphila TaxID=65700 RepID=A0A0M2KKS2_9GAMM|nr:penicillin-binding protein activator [Erwinia tracheiphila]EOS95079.1 lipoprotein [Erwinia tracheiphila PSU-1]KKF37843.1 penicillin-binding protein [Erwinia tracheiphila]UIA87562.1 penicillin-binding protein activator [Erwinia tracheiphila]UIA95927.1 penicillin-binding protein activator [Erwinia tracheiphila]